jgi:uncharacterized damage-inducible protein DinB
MKLLLSLACLLCVFSLTAQSNLNEILKEQMVKDWERAKTYTQEYLDAMPADKYNFRAVDSIRSFAKQMLHLAFTNVAMATVAASVPDSGFQNVMKWQSLEESPAMQNKDSVVQYVNTSYDFMINAVKSLPVGKLSEIVNQRTGGGARSETRLAWLMKAFEHQTHHRGQCTIYIRLLGIRPPGEKLF